MASAAPFVLFDHGPTGDAMLFEAPSQIIRATTAAEVPGAFQRMQAATQNGYWLAGRASYELGYLFSSKLHHLLPEDRDQPLLEFGVFDAPSPGATLFRNAAEEAADTRLKQPEPLWAADQYKTACGKVQDYITAGDTYQVNLTMPMTARFEGSVLGLYGALAMAQPVPHGALLDLGGDTVLSRSPELFFEIANGEIRTRPMKGTQPRGKTVAEDNRARQWLQQDPKNRAENLMIVDLLRNDISRIAKTGTVRVPELFKVETYTTVHQMVSTVRAALRDGVTLAEIFGALFPCGSITGAPKIRAMQIIRELEPDPRGAYCGSLGWVAPGGDMCFNVAIRTLTVTGPGLLQLNVGGGVVHDSTASSEYEEALWKARFTNLSPTI